MNGEGIGAGSAREDVAVEGSGGSPMGGERAHGTTSDQSLAALGVRA